MKIPKGKGFDITNGLVITVVLDEYSLTGTLLGDVGDRHHCDSPPDPIDVNVDVNVEVDIDPEFILLQLTCPVCLYHGPELPVGTIIAINVFEILFIFAGGECDSSR